MTTVGIVPESTRSRSKNLTTFVIAALAVGYFLIECLYCVTLPLVMDEFANAKHIARVFESVPYRDYAPYKGILGYLIQAPALLWVDDPWWSLIFVKIETAGIVALCLFFLGRWLCRRFGSGPAIAALALLVTHSTFLERSADLRVDMLSSLAGTALLVALLEKRIILAGVLGAVSVLMTQKAVFFPLAGGAALLLQFAKERSRPTLNDGLRFAGAGVGTFSVYFLVAVLVGDF